MGCGQSSEASTVGPVHTKNELAVSIEQPRTEFLPAEDNQRNYTQQTYPNQIQTQQSYQEKYSIREISLHNAQKGFCDLFPWKNNVHSSEIFKEDIKEDFKESENEIPENYTWRPKLDFRENWGTLPVGVVMRYGMKYSVIKKHIMHSKVAVLNVYNDTQYSKDIRQDAEGIEYDLKHDSEITVYQMEYLEVLYRYYELFDKYSGSIPRNNKISSGDPNLLSFPLPDRVIKDVSSLRKWAENWEVFDTECIYDNPWNCPWEYLEPTAPVIDELLTIEELYRPDLEPQTFDFTIEDVAWDVIPEDIFKNDETTPQQDEILDERAKRTDLHDIERMKRRREELANYFIRERADGLTTYCDNYLGFADALQEGWNKFQELCEN